MRIHILHIWIVWVVGHLGLVRHLIVNRPMVARRVMARPHRTVTHRVARPTVRTGIHRNRQIWRNPVVVVLHDLLPTHPSQQNNSKKMSSIEVGVRKFKIKISRFVALLTFLS